MPNSSPEIALKFVEEILANFDKFLIGREKEPTEDLVWALWNLTETGDEELIDKGIIQSLKWFKIAAPIIQASFIYYVNCFYSFPLTSLLCSTAARHGISFPSHLLTENTFEITCRTPMSQRVMGFGTNSTYNLGIPSTQEVKEPRVIQIPENVKKVQMSTTHTVFLTIEGNLYGCGQGSAGQLGPKNKCLVVTPSLIFQAAEDTPIVDIAVGDGFTVFITEKKLYICGKYGQIAMKQDGFFSCKPDIPEKMQNILITADVIQVFGKSSVFLFSPIDGTLKDPAVSIANSFNSSQSEAWRKISRIKTAQMELASIDQPAGPKFKIVAENKSVRGVTKLQIINKTEKCAAFVCSSGDILNCRTLFSINGLIVDLIVYSFNLTRDGQVRMIASTKLPQNRALYTGQAHLVPAWHSDDFELVSDKHNKNKKFMDCCVVFMLEEFPHSQGVTSVETSPDGKNTIYIIDKDPYQMKKIHEGLHELNFTKKEDYKEMANSVDKLVLSSPGKAVLNIEKLNQEKQEYMEPILMDIYVPKTLKPQACESRKPNARLDFLKALYPDVSNYIKDGAVSVDKNVIGSRLKTARDYLLLAFFNGHDVIPQETIKYLYAEMFFSDYKKPKMEIFKKFDGDDYSRQKLIFNEFLADYLGEIGLTAEEILPDKYLLRSIYAEFYTDYLTTTVTVITGDSCRLPYNWELLCLQSDYFSAAMMHMVGDTVFKIEYPKPLVISALRIFLEPNHLYDLPYEDLFQLLDLYDRYLCMAAIKDTFTVIFEQATEANVHLIFDAFERMEHLRELMERHFLKNMQMILYWKSQIRPPLALIKMVEVEVERRRNNDDESPKILAMNIFTRGVVFGYKPLKEIPEDEDEEESVTNWSRVGFDSIFHLLSTGNGLNDYETFSDIYKHEHNRMQRHCREILARIMRPDFDFRKQSVYYWKFLKNTKIDGDEEGEKKKKTRIRLNSTQEAESSKERGRLPSLGNDLANISIPEDVVVIPEEIEAEESKIEEGAGSSPELQVEKLLEELEIDEKIAENYKNEQNIDPNFPGMVSSSFSTPKRTKEKLVFPKRSSQAAKNKVIDVPQQKASPAPWLQRSNNIPEKIKSLKEIQQEEEEAAKNKQQTKPVAITPRIRKNTWQESPAAPSSASPGSFAAIMAEEQRKLNPEKKPAKSLEAVTMEERAMQELLAEYQAQFDGEAVISVSVAPRNE